MKLSEITPHVGMQVISAVGNAGVVVDLHAANTGEIFTWRSYDVLLGDTIVRIDWENGKTSQFPLKELDAVTVA